ncbi:TlpA disulfide reductase family protein [Magnetospirillum molischianum]|uniref:Thiol-disulfide isomerase and thioredoxins n=1 Tax=Magnetospirillum molischianum DSM 120 TaxID=1150626 RepID=H8FQT3_MAGML|nr:TlpA disulfide reductase family protein [Magnetospirillum molischianum]CCG40721.1 Thiol-disulfide isomerase and thioredoxins [Magnetospirillum molischianum DSM 120]
MRSDRLSRRAVLGGLLAGTILPASSSWAAGSTAGLFLHPSPIPLPPLNMQDGDGKSVGLDSLRGKAVLLNLWASWCTPCVAELPALDRMKPLLARTGLAVVALAIDRGGVATCRATFARLGIQSLEIRTGDPRILTEALGARVLPITLLIDRKGDEVGRVIGAADWEGASAVRLLAALAEGRPLSPDMAPTIGGGKR